jgi:hypothetical protein
LTVARVFLVWAAEHGLVGQTAGGDEVTPDFAVSPFSGPPATTLLKEVFIGKGRPHLAAIAWRGRTPPRKLAGLAKSTSAVSEPGVDHRRPED